MMDSLEVVVADAVATDAIITAAANRFKKVLHHCKRFLKRTFNEITMQYGYSCS